MTYLGFLVNTIIFIVIATPVAIVIFKFFGLTFVDYGNYLMWFIALALFSAILPLSQNSIFKDVTKEVEKTIDKIGDTVAPTPEVKKGGRKKVSK